MSINDWLVLNVSGKIFATSRSTLVSVPGSVLSAMFDPDSSRPPAKLQDGTFLIDACPQSFAVILNYLRYKEVMIPPNMNPNHVKVVAAYFALDTMVDLIDRNIQEDLQKQRLLEEKKSQVNSEILAELQDIVAELQSAKWDSGQGSGWLVSVNDPD